MKRFFSIALLFFAAKAGAQDYKSFPMWNYNLPFEQRVNDVVSRLTLEEKVHQMLNTTPAIPRLGILAYDWWNETLHGVARTPYRVTSYPQAIAMAATWDSNSLYRMADYSAMEGRAIQNIAIEQGKTKDRYLGLTYWTPNINIFRDPRWGRGQETYGEEVVQLYVSTQNKNIHAPLKALKGFQRIALKAGESKTVTFNLTADDLSLVNEEGKLYLPKGKLMISVGGGQPGVKNKTTSNVVSKMIAIL